MHFLDLNGDGKSFQGNNHSCIEAGFYVVEKIYNSMNPPTQLPCLLIFFLIVESEKKV